MKIVKESLDKYSFERKEDKLSSLGIGQKPLIEKWLEKMFILDYIINDDLTIDIDNYVDLRYKNLIEFPEYIQFNKINGYFDCSNNYLISLRGCPKIVNEYFACENNNLKAIQNIPFIVKGGFYCSNNKVQFTEERIRSLCDVKGIVYC